MTAELPQTDRRRHRRHEVYVQVHVKRGRVDLVMEVHDISESGAYIELGTLDRPKWLELGQEVQLGLFLPESVEQFEVIANVVRIVESLDSRGFAVQFHESEEAREAVLGLIAEAAPRPPPLPSPATSDE